MPETPEGQMIPGQPPGAEGTQTAEDFRIDIRKRFPGAREVVAKDGSTSYVVQDPTLQMGSNCLCDGDMGAFVIGTGVNHQFDESLMTEGRFVVYGSSPDHCAMYWDGAAWQWLPGFPEKLETNPDDWRDDPNVKAM